VADRMSKNPATTVPQTPLPNVTYAVGGLLESALAVLRVATLMKNVPVRPLPKFKIG
jgi:hypothetical protein